MALGVVLFLVLAGGLVRYWVVTSNPWDCCTAHLRNNFDVFLTDEEIQEGRPADWTRTNRDTGQMQCSSDKIHWVDCHPRAKQ